jgi:CheY-like chemotaxis protein
MEEKHGLVVELKIVSEPVVEDPDLRGFLFEATRELLLNVRKHAATDRAVVSLLAVECKKVCIEVWDNGKGFEPELLDEFTAKHFGLLRIRHRLIWFGGSMTIASAPERGTLVRMLAPLQLHVAIASADAVQAVPPVATPAVPLQAGPASTVRRIRVLIVDDHQIVRKGLCEILQKESDMEVVGEAADGHEALESARRLAPDVVIMDVSMPRMNGIDATRAIRIRMPEMRVVALSMHERADMADAMRAAGAHAYLPKDGPAEDLLSAIRAQS